GVAAANFFNNASSQTFSRRDEIHNVEINLLHQSLLDPSSRCGIVGLAGVRWFHFQENLWYSSTSTLGTATYAVRTINDLIGIQAGARGHYYLRPNLRLYAQPKVGVYSNSIQSRSQLYDNAGHSG